MTPEYLYHYTNIETLALILSKRTIRFSSLAMVDDRQEMQVADLKNIGQFCYVSSWTSAKKESIPMWNMYSSLQSGVRLKMKTYPFLERENKPEEFEKEGFIIDDQTNGVYPKSLIPYIEYYLKGFTVVPNAQKDILHKVEYSNDDDKLNPKLLEASEESLNIATGKLGKYKNTHWEFQREWRYIITCFPIDPKKIDVEGKYIRSIHEKMLRGELTRPFNYYDIKISQDAFESIELTLSPKISDGNRIIIQDLLEKYNPNMAIKESALLGTL